VLRSISLVYSKRCIRVTLLITIIPKSKENLHYICCKSASTSLLFWIVEDKRQLKRQRKSLKSVVIEYKFN